MGHCGAGWSGVWLILFQHMGLCPNCKSAPLHAGQLQSVGGIHKGSAGITGCEDD